MLINQLESKFLFEGIINILILFTKKFLFASKVIFLKPKIYEIFQRKVTIRTNLLKSGIRYRTVNKETNHILKEILISQKGRSC